MYLNPVPDANNVCQACDATCKAGNCTVGNSSTNCTACANSSYFLSSLNSCVAPNNCGTGYVGVLAADSTSGINKCETTCTNSKGIIY